MQMTEEGNDKFEGIEKSILAQMIELLRERYTAASYALTYLEARSLEYDLVGLANQRDVLSHFATICDASKSLKKREESLASAEEHLRRAIVEPYQTVLEERLARFIDVYKDYEKNIFKKEKLVKLDKVTDHDHIRQEIETIKKLDQEARDKKNCNIWNAEWEDAVECFKRAYDKVVALDDLLFSYRKQYYSVMVTRRLQKWSTIVAAGITVLVAFLFSPAFSKLIDYLFRK